MALSVFGVCASAANVEDYADADEITYSEAVGVLSGLGVLIGDDDGSFHPGNTLLREQAAKIASYLIGLQDQVTQGPTFSDVAEDNWAKGYIAICEANGLIAGNGDGTFAPDGTLTGYEWEKIVICALGYDAAKTNMLGDSWQGGVVALANELDLLDGLNEDYDAGRAITREEAAQIAFNALSRGTVKYKLDNSLLGTPTGVTLGEKIFHLSVKNTFDVFGAPVAKVYYNNKTNKEYASFAYSAVASYNNEAKGVKAAKIVADLEDAGVKNPSVTYYVDGQDKTGVTTEFGGRGVDVSVYKYTNLETGKDVYRAVEINTYVEVLDDETSYNKEEKNANGTVTAAAYYILDKGTEETNKNVYLPAEGFKDKDIITYNVGDEKNLGKPANTVAVNAAVQTLVGGTATTVSYDGSEKSAAKGYVAFDKGDNLYYSKNYKYGTIKDDKVVVNSYYGTVYDNYGNIIYITDAERQTVSTKGHLYLIDAISYYDEDQYVVPGGLYYPIKEQEADAQALVILYTDDTASVEVVDLAIAQKANGEYALVNKYGFVDGDAKSFKIGVNPIATALQEGFVEYYVNEDGEYVIDTCTDADGDVEICEGKKEIYRNDAGEKLDGTSSTKITYLTATVNPYTDLTKDTIAEVAKNITVTATTVVGYSAFLEADGAGYVEKTEGTKFATVGAVLIPENVNSSIVYGMFTGTVETNSGTGEVYSFLLSDGSTVKYSVADASDHDAVAQKLKNKISGGKNSGVFNATTDKENVYKLAINSENQLVAYSKLSVGYYGTVTTVSYGDYGYLKTTDTYTGDWKVDNYFGASFKGQAYDAIAKKAVSVNTLGAANTANKYVAVYTVATEDSKIKGKQKDQEIVFVKVVKPYEEYEVTLNAHVYDQGVLMIADSVVANAENPSTLNELTYFVGTGKLFNSDSACYIYGDEGLKDQIFYKDKETKIPQSAITAYQISAGNFKVTAKVTKYTNGSANKDELVKAVADDDWKLQSGSFVSQEANADETEYTFVTCIGKDENVTYTVAHNTPYKASECKDFALNALKYGDTYTLVLKNNNVVFVNNTNGNFGTVKANYATHIGATCNHASK
jgi:hypothetical protein